MVEIPRLVGRYRIEGIIGTGGYATVYRAIDERLDATVAVKVLAENHCFDPDVRERFLQEGRILRHIGSTHVVAVHDLGETERGQPYLVLDYADRGNLDQRVDNRHKSGWRPQPADVVAVAESLADALTAVHARDIVHRDLAPRNILLRSTRVASGSTSDLIGSDEQLVLADLGLSKDLATASGLTVAGGTAGFAPPEQRDGPTRVDQRADLWAASAVLVWLLLTAPPDDAGRWAGGLHAIGWASALEPALAMGLATDPERRPPDARAWLATIRSAFPHSDTTPPLHHDLGPTSPSPSAAAMPPPSATAKYPPGIPLPTASSGTDSSSPVESNPPSTARSRPSRWRRPLAGGLALFVVGAAAGVAGWQLVESDDGGGGGAGGETGDTAADTLTGQRVESLDNGRVRVSSTAGTGELAVIGPREVTLGETVTFQAATTPETRIAFWVGTDGLGLGSDATADVTASNVGPALVRLYGADERGHVIEVRFEFSVVEN